MSLECTVGNFIAISGLAIKVHADYDTLGDYRQISEEALALHVLIGKAAQHLKSATISSDNLHYGRKVLKSCQDVLEELNSLIQKYKSLAAINERVARVKLGKAIVTLQERLISDTVLLNGFVRRFVVPDILPHQSYKILIFCLSCEYAEVQAQLAGILGLHHRSPRVSVTSIASFAANTNIQVAYRQFCKDLYRIGVTEDIVRRKNNEILATLRSQGMVASNTRGRSQLLRSLCLFTYIQPLIYQQIVVIHLYLGLPPTDNQDLAWVDRQWISYQRIHLQWVSRLAH